MFQPRDPDKQQPSGPTPGPNPAASPSHRPPAILSLPPNARLLLKALRRRWAAAFCLGVLFAAGAGLGIWFLVPPPKHSVQTVLRVFGNNTSLLRGPGGESDNEVYRFQRGQLATLKSRSVLKAALAKEYMEVGGELRPLGGKDLPRAAVPGADGRVVRVVELSVVAQKADPLEWLMGAIKGDFAIAPNQFRITLSGDQPEELRTLLTAVRDAYMEEAHKTEHAERRWMLDKVKELREKYEAQVRESREKQEEALRRGAGASDATTRALTLALLNQHLTTINADIIRVRGDIIQAEADLAIKQGLGKDLDAAPVPPILLAKHTSDDRQVRKLLEEQARVNETLEQIKARAKGRVRETRIQSLTDRLKEIDESLAARRKELEPEARKRIREDTANGMNLTLSDLKIKKAGLEKQEKLLAEHQKGIREQINTMLRNGVKQDGDKEDLSHIEELAHKFAREEQLLKVQDEAARRTEVIEEPTIRYVNGTLRLAGMAGAGALAAFALALLGVALWEFRVRRVDSVDEVVEGLGINVVGTVPNAPRPRPNRAQDPHVQAILTESIDATRTMLLHAARQEGIKVVMVGSATGGEGKTSLASHLAASVARAGLKVLLIDADLRNPTAHRLFGLDNQPGLSELLRGEAQAADVTRQSPVGGLALIPAGRWDARAVQALVHDRMREILAQLRGEYQFIVIDSSPVLPVSDGLLIGQAVDGVILSILREVSRIPHVYAAYQRVSRLGIRILGAVVNGVIADTYVSAYPLTSHKTRV